MQRDFIAMALYFIVLIGLWIRFKGKRLSRFLIWTGIFMLLYFCILEIQNRTFFILIPLFFFYYSAISTLKKNVA